MSTRLYPLALLASIAFLPALSTAAQPAATENARIEHILAQRAKVKDIPAVALSPDGKHLAWIVAHDDTAQLLLADGNGQNPRAVTLPGGCHDVGLRWAPAADQLAVLTRCKVDPANTKPIHGAIWLLDAGTQAAPRKLAAMEGFAQGLQWSHDGQSLAFLYVPGATRLPYATASSNPRVGVIGGTDLQIQHIARIALAGGPVQILTPADLYVYEFRLSPAGNRIAYTAAPPPGDDNWWSAKLYTQAASSGAAPKVVVNPATTTSPLHGLQIALPRWSPDGSAIFFIGGLMSDRGATGGDLYRVAAGGGPATDLTPAITVTPSWYTFLAPHTLLVNQIASGSVEVAEYTLTNNRARQTRLWYTAPGVLGDGRAAFAVALTHTVPRRIAYAANAFDQPPEVHAGVLSTAPPPAVTSINAGLEHAWGKAESVTWEHHGTRVQGWLMYPAHYNPRQTYPLIVYVHGGPTWANLPRWDNSASALSEFDYFVLLPNPRGSLGEGEAFAQGIRGQMGYGDLADILAGVDKVERMVPVDPARLGLTGWSYGGFMSMFAPTQTGRFKAVVAGAGISNWQSYYGENQIDGWMLPFFGASVYVDPAPYAKSSAINFITHDHTPALIVVGERDEECPAPQSFEYWHALKTLGVPTTLVVYANQGHAIANRADQADILRRTLDWFGRYLAAAPRP
ncbi:MAG: S9 family peptidase [Rhodanobacteraceae bacterium]|nr:MAG: S9 family peptidase [Rhodanobacteraceae bacterium]